MGAVTYFSTLLIISMVLFKIMNTFWIQVNRFNLQLCIVIAISSLILVISTPFSFDSFSISCNIILILSLFISFHQFTLYKKSKIFAGQKTLHRFKPIIWMNSD